MNRPDLFTYSEARQYLNDVLAFRKSKDEGFSVRKWAKEMDLGSHALLVYLLQGKRQIRIQHLGFLLKGLKLTAQERLYLQALVQYEGAASIEEKDLCRLWLSELNPTKEFEPRLLNEFKVVAEWYHMAILSLCETEGFDGSPKEAARRLGGRITAEQAKQAIERMISLGLLEKTGLHLKPTQKRLTTRNDIADAGARHYFKQTMDLAVQAVDQIPLEQRECQSFSIAISKDKMSLAKQMIRKFRTQFSQLIGEGSADEVFQFNLQFFQLTETSSARTEKHALPMNQEINI